ncbi:hypothetical protein AURDEDRAFT_173500 [Auricularia subglabra TFB-10046 SS5]|nr:hypothetical protein AURDEDRAFT_173500 [Auricularia subglabra TFB-10046 SS5]
MAMNRLRGHAATPRSELAIDIDEYKKREHIDDGHDVMYGHPNDGTLAHAVDRRHAHLAAPSDLAQRQGRPARAADK